MHHLNQVVIQWDEHTIVTLSVNARRRDGPPTGEEWRLAQEIAAHIWATWHLAEVEATSEE